MAIFNCYVSSPEGNNTATTGDWFLYGIILSGLMILIYFNGDYDNQ